MREIECIRYEPGVVHVLDQTRLPGEEVWLGLRDAPAVAEAIYALRVRGAPLIGVSAAYGLAAVARNAPDPLAALERGAPVIRKSRPTAVNLAWAVDRVMDAARAAGSGGVADAVEREASAIHHFERDNCRAMGEHGAGLLAPGTRLMTVCNTGMLATGGTGTAFAVIRTGYETGLVEQAWVPETRPLLQGARLTAWELTQLGIPFHLITDNATGATFSRGLVDGVVVGADRIARNGDTANKVGTYNLAVLASRHDVPFYVVAPTSTIDLRTASGAEIPIEERSADEVRTLRGLAIAPADAPAFNPAFDVTPASLISAIVTERGVHRPPYDFSRLQAG